MISLFFSYSHRDEALRDELEIHLAMLKRGGLVKAWHDRRIPPGESVRSEISEHLEKADVVLTLLSPYFLASDYCYDVEMTRALERQRSGEARVIPVILEPCDWLNSPLRDLRATPRDGKAVSKFPNLHDAFLEITNDIRLAAEELGKNASGASTMGAVVPLRREPDVRTSNLRVKKAFSDHERDSFIDGTFEYLATFIENSLEELSARSPEITHRFKRAAEELTASIYSSGVKRASCRIWVHREDFMGADIAYSTNESARSGSYNDSMKVEDDGYQLGFRPTGLMGGTRAAEEYLSPHGVSEYFWSILIGPLQ